MVVKRTKHRYSNEKGKGKGKGDGKVCGSCKKFMKCFTESNDLLGVSNNQQLWDESEMIKCMEIPSCKEYEEVE